MVRERLSPVDTAWLRMEDPTNLMMITGFMTFSAPIEMERLAATLEQRLLRPFDRFRQRVAPPLLPFAAWRWQDDPTFDLSNHLQRVTLPPPGDETALKEMVSHLMGTPLDLEKPLWQIHLVENYGEGSALIVRLHHCIADGLALVHVLLSLTDATPDAPWPAVEPELADHRRRGPLEAMLRPALKATTQIAETLLREGQALVSEPAYLQDLVQKGTNAAASTARLVLRWPDPKTLFKGRLGTAKRAAWSAPIPLTDVKAVGRAVGGTVNDVLLTAVAGALRRYMLGRDAEPEGLNLRAVVPVNLRPLDAKPTLGNKFGLVFLALPVGIADPVERLRELKRRMDELKDTPEAVILFGILGFAGASPAQVQSLLVDIFGTKATAVMTNVPGPRETLYLAGAPLDTIMFWVPQSGKLGLGVSILSYAGQVWLGVATDVGLVPDPETIIAEYHAEFDALAALARQAAAQPTPEAPAEGAPQPAIQAMLELLQETNQKLEALLEQKAAGATDQCQALTKSGQPCKNRALPGAEFCRVHQASR